MNITHAVKEEVIGDRLVAIFERQKELMGKYHDIELRSGLLQTEDCPVNLDDKRGQARIKDFSWRVMEEVGEALDAYVHGDEAHFHEELIDGLHFLTELTILTGVTPEEITSGALFTNPVDMLDALRFLPGTVVEEFDGSLIGNVTDLVMQLGMMCNCLKNKPWKQNQMKTDKTAFKQRLAEVWCIYISILNAEMTLDQVADTYLRKSQVNKFRQRSNY